MEEVGQGSRRLHWTSERKTAGRIVMPADIVPGGTFPDYELSPPTTALP
jgi:hypothetical protein